MDRMSPAGEVACLLSDLHPPRSGYACRAALPARSDAVNPSNPVNPVRFCCFAGSAELHTLIHVGNPHETARN